MNSNWPWLTHRRIVSYHEEYRPEQNIGGSQAVRGWAIPFVVIMVST